MSNLSTKEFFETVNPNTSKGASLVYRSNQYHGRALYDCYAKPSALKERIWEHWCNVCRELDETGYIKTNIHVVSYNSNFFTIGFETDTDWYYITPAHNYKIPKL